MAGIKKQYILTFKFLKLNTYKKLITLFSLLLFSIPSFATHLIGGNIGYKYIGDDPFIQGNSMYRVILDAYIDCNSINWSTNGTVGTFPEKDIQVGVYEGVLNPANPLPYSSELTLFLQDSNKVDPNLPEICNPFNLLSNVCVYLVRYEATVTLAPSSKGYWILYDRCCRPSGLLNLNNSGDQSFAYTTWIPAQNGALINNTSVQFNDTLLSYICRTDTAYISNTATDIDGDSLVYSLVTPFIGKTGKGGITPPPSAPYNSTLLNPYTIPPATVIYQSGYNLTKLLGTGSFSAIDSKTGLTRFLTNSAGTFVAAVEITEYRKGNIIAKTRRNMQLISDNCPNNNMPDQDISNLNPAATSPLSYKIDAGNNLCFDLNYTDLDGDPLEFVATSDIFNPLITNPAATVTSPIKGNGSVTGTICWNTSCTQAQNTPYLIDVVVTDSNCPPLPLPQQLYLSVKPFKGPKTIFGSNVICIDNTPSIFTTDTIPNTTYNWTITGGSITSGTGTSTIEVLWSPGQTTGSLSVIATSQYGCISDPISKNITLSDVTAKAGPDQTTCNATPITLGGSPTTTNLNNIISWSPTTGLNDATSPNPIATPQKNTTYIVSLTNSFGCVGTDTVNIDINYLKKSGIDNQYFLCPGDTLNMAATGSTFTWSPNLFINSVNTSNPKIYPTSNRTYTLNYTDVNGCSGTDVTNIIVNSKVPTNAGIDTSICMGDSFTLGGSPTSPNGTNYSWSPAININNHLISNPTILATTSSTYVIQTSNDTCVGIDSVKITVLPLPIIITIPDIDLCIGDSTPILANGIGTFIWNNGNTLTDSTISNPIAFPTKSTLYKVVLTGSNTCSSTDSINVEVQPLPLITASQPINACKLIPTPLTTSPIGPNKARYLWQPTTGLDFNELAIPTFNYNNDVTYTVQVTDTFGCVAIDTMAVTVFRINGNVDTTLCNNLNYNLNTNLVNGNKPYNYLWKPAQFVSDPTATTPSIITGSNNKFNVTVTDANNCKDSLSIRVNSFASTHSNFTYKLIPTCNGIGAQITNNSTGANGV